MIKVKHLKQKNPKDEKFLELIKIKRNLVNNLYLYNIYYGNEKIGQFIILKGDNHIHEMEIFEDKYKRKGLATFMHEYIEKNLGIEIVASDALSRAGERFYQARKKKNPTDKEFLKTIFIEKEHDKRHHTIEYFVYRNEDKSKRDRNGKLSRAISLASAYYDTEDKWVYDLFVKPLFQRKGLASFLYDYIENDNKIKLKPSNYLLDDGKAFWKARLK